MQFGKVDVRWLQAKMLHSLRHNRAYVFRKVPYILYEDFFLIRGGGGICLFTAPCLEIFNWKWKVMKLFFPLVFVLVQVDHLFDFTDKGQNMGDQVPSKFQVGAVLSAYLFVFVSWRVQSNLPSQPPLHPTMCPPHQIYLILFCLYSIELLPNATTCLMLLWAIIRARQKLCSVWPIFNWL